MTGGGGGGCCGCALCVNDDDEERATGQNIFVAEPGTGIRTLMLLQFTTGVI